MTPVSSIRRGDRVVLALGGGAARGMAHIGVCRVLEQEGIVLAGVAGTSIGAAVGGIVAAGELDACEARMREMTRKRVITLLDPIIPRSGLFAGTRISQGRSANITWWAPSLAAESTESSLDATA